MPDLEGPGSPSGTVPVRCMLRELKLFLELTLAGKLRGQTVKVGGAGWICGAENRLGRQQDSGGDGR
jgi:hypothetical protein